MRPSGLADVIEAEDRLRRFALDHVASPTPASERMLRSLLDSCTRVEDEVLRPLAESHQLAVSEGPRNGRLREMLDEVASGTTSLEGLGDELLSVVDGRHRRIADDVVAPLRRALCDDEDERLARQIEPYRGDHHVGA